MFKFLKQYKLHLSIAATKVHFKIHSYLSLASGQFLENFLKNNLFTDFWFKLLDYKDQFGKVILSPSLPLSPPLSCSLSLVTHSGTSKFQCCEHPYRRTYKEKTKSSSQQPERWWPANKLYWMGLPSLVEPGDDCSPNNLTITLLVTLRKTQLNHS